MIKTLLAIVLDVHAGVIVDAAVEGEKYPWLRLTRAEFDVLAPEPPSATVTSAVKVVVQELAVVLMKPVRAGIVLQEKETVVFREVKQDPVLLDTAPVKAGWSEHWIARKVGMTLVVPDAVPARNVLGASVASTTSNVPLAVAGEPVTLKMFGMMRLSETVTEPPASIAPNVMLRLCGFWAS
jgi:hypothetical protein